MERRLSIVFFLLAILIALPKCYGQGIEVACPSSASVMPYIGATVNNSTGGSKQWLCVSNVNGQVTTTSAFTTSGGITINPTNNVLPVRSNATTFIDSHLTDNATRILSSEPVATSTLVTTANSPSCSVTGAGTGATCTVGGTGSSNMAGQMLINTGTTPAALGTATLNFTVGFTNVSFCVWTLKNGANGSWNARATAIIPSSGGAASAQTVNWDNNAVALTGSTSDFVRLVWICAGD